MPYNHTAVLHRVQCISRFVHGLRAEALAIAPHRTIVGSKGQFVKMTETSLPLPLRSNSVVHSLLPQKPSWGPASGRKCYLSLDSRRSLANGTKFSGAFGATLCMACSH